VKKSFINLKLIGIVALGIIALSSLIGGCSGNNNTTSRTTSPSATKSSTTQPTGNTDSQVTISLRIANRNIKAGESFTIDAVIDSKLIIRSGQCGLTFDPSLMKCDQVVEGNFFKSWAEANGATTMVFPQPAIDNTKGSVSTIGIAIMGLAGGGGSTGNGILFTYHFTALKDGTIAPKLNDTVVGYLQKDTMIDYTNIKIIN
jgi:hypothetical protein